MWICAFSPMLKYRHRKLPYLWLHKGNSSKISQCQERRHVETHFRAWTNTGQWRGSNPETVATGISEHSVDLVPVVLSAICRLLLTYPRIISVGQGSMQHLRVVTSGQRTRCELKAELTSSTGTSRGWLGVPARASRQRGRSVSGECLGSRSDSAERSGCTA